MADEHYQLIQRVHNATAGLNYVLEVFGEHLAEQEGFKGLSGMEAVHLYLIRKHSWLPRDVRSMSLEDLRFVLHPELEAWTVPPAARAAVG